MNADQLWETTMDKTNRHLRQITISDSEKASEEFERLMGEQVGPRKQFIEENAHKANIAI